jgi:predicted ABC-type ATPase
MIDQAEDEPWIWIIAGPNGAGKTTFATQALRDDFHLNHFVNTDEIARLLSPENPDAVLMQSGRLMLVEFERLRRAKVSFAVETTLSSTSYLRRVHEMRTEGWKCGMVYVWLNSPKLSHERVLARVNRGGHNVPEDVVFRRYERSQNNLINYLDVCDKVYVFDNSDHEPTYVAHGEEGWFAYSDHPLADFMQDNWLTDKND